MKLHFAALVALLFCHEMVLGQHSLPGDLHLSTQFSIDGFISEYPGTTFIEGDVIIDGPLIENLEGLAPITGIGGNLRIGSQVTIINFFSDLIGLHNLTHVGGNVEIINNGTLASLTGLQGLESIGGDLRLENNLPLAEISALWNLRSVGGNIIIRKNHSLVNLSGLNGISSIQGSLVLQENPSLLNLLGMESMTYIYGSLKIFSNEKLISFTGLDNLAAIEDTLFISGNGTLTDLTGMGSLVSVKHGVWIGGPHGGNTNLTSLEGLKSLTHIGGFLKVENNPSLSSLTGLDNLNPNSLRGLYIWNNHKLSTCENAGILAFILDPKGKIEIYQNADGCNNPAQVARSGGYDMPCLPYGNYSFHTQEDIDRFSEYFDGCTDLSGDMIISGDGITSLEGLSGIMSINGNLVIFDNDLLTSLAGLDNLAYVTRGLYIGENDLLPDLEGMGSLQHIGEFLEIDFNERLLSLDGLQSLTHAGNLIHIEGNRSLESLDGLESLDVTELDHLILLNNFNLTSCAIPGMCECMDLPTCHISAFNNGNGCATPSQAAQACDPNHTQFTPITEACSYTQDRATGEVIFSFQLSYPTDVNLVVYDQTGRVHSTVVDHLMESGSHEITWKAEDPSGVYFYSLTADSRTSIGELVVSR